jgi:hypothetical protein
MTARQFGASPPGAGLNCWFTRQHRADTRGPLPRGCGTGLSWRHVSSWRTRQATCAICCICTADPLSHRYLCKRRSPILMCTWVNGLLPHLNYRSLHLGYLSGRTSRPSMFRSARLSEKRAPSIRSPGYHPRCIVNTWEGGVVENLYLDGLG